MSDHTPSITIIAPEQVVSLWVLVRGTDGYSRLVPVSPAEMDQLLEELRTTEVATPVPTR